MGNAVETWVTDKNNSFHSFSTSHKLSWDSISITWQRQQENVFYFFTKPDMNIHTTFMLRLKVFTPKWKHRFGAMAVEGHILNSWASFMTGCLHIGLQKKDRFNYVREVFQRQPENNIMDWRLLEVVLWSKNQLSFFFAFWNFVYQTLATQLFEPYFREEGFIFEVEFSLLILHHY